MKQIIRKLFKNSATLSFTTNKQLTSVEQLQEDLEKFAIAIENKNVVKVDGVD